MTQIVGVIGDPIKHSLSPVMQTAALKQAEIDASYKSFHVVPDDLVKFVEKARQKKYRGFNVTLPHKQTIFPLLDQIRPDARMIGAVNTVLHQEGQLIGYNTDDKGYLLSLAKEKDWSPQGKVVTLLGAGGAARAVAHGLLHAGAEHVFILNRTAANAVTLAADLKAIFPEHVSTRTWNNTELDHCFTQSQLLVNATSVGLDGTAFDYLPLHALPKDALVSDLVYTPRETPLLKDAQAAGLNTHEGLGMLVYQGAESFKIWFGVDPDVTVMRQVLEEALR